MCSLLLNSSWCRTSKPITVYLVINIIHNIILMKQTLRFVNICGDNQTQGNIKLLRHGLKMENHLIMTLVKYTLLFS